MNHAAEALEIIENAKRILLHLHPKPDQDSVGSALATYYALTQRGKEVTVIAGDSKLPETFRCLPGFKKIVPKNYFEIDTKKFDLFIVQDSGDKRMISKNGEVIFPETLKTIVIDHHQTNTKFGDINIVNTSSAATAELLFDLYKEWGIEITKDIAACLYVGIYGDTGGFKYPNTTPHTFKVAYELTRIYPEFPQLIGELENNNSKAKIYFDALALNSIETFFDDTVAISSVSFGDLEAKHITKEDTDNNIISNILITVKEWKVGVTLIEKLPEEVGVSFRSKNIDVAKVSQSLGGGGHKLASGATLKMPLSEAKKKVVDALEGVC